MLFPEIYKLLLCETREGHSHIRYIYQIYWSNVIGKKKYISTSYTFLIDNDYNSWHWYAIYL